ncbi:MAG: acyl-CoA thioesterase [Burkholderiales bacterium]
MNPKKAVPESREGYRHFVSITTRLMDNDVYAHVNNATYYSFIDTAVTSYLADALDRNIARDPIVYYVVENGCTYFSPVAFPDVVHCGLRVSHIGTSSMRFEVGLFRNDEALTAARGFFVQVCCDRETERPIVMPANVRAALQAIRSGA